VLRIIADSAVTRSSFLVGARHHAAPADTLGPASGVNDGPVMSTPATSVLRRYTTEYSWRRSIAEDKATLTDPYLKKGNSRSGPSGLVVFQLRTPHSTKHFRSPLQWKHHRITNGLSVTLNDAEVASILMRLRAQGAIDPRVPQLPGPATPSRRAIMAITPKTERACPIQTRHRLSGLR
jgi:hypothetical protein